MIWLSPVGWNGLLMYEPLAERRGQGTSVRRMCARLMEFSD